MKFWAIFLGSAAAGGVVARASLFLGLLVFGVGAAVAYRSKEG